MRRHLLRGSRIRLVWLGAPAALVMFGACSGKDNHGEPSATTTTTTTMSTSTGMGGMGMGGAGGAGGGAPTLDPKLTPAAAMGDYKTPFDAVPDASGANFYFTANNPSKGPGVFTVPAGGGTVKEVAVGDPFAGPFGIGITPDDKTLIVADASAGDDPNDDKKDAPGGIYSVPAAGGTATLVAGTLGYRPCGVEIAGDQIYFGGTDPADNKPGVFKVPVAGGSVTAVSKDPLLSSPCGIAITKSGDLYVVDTVNGSNAAGKIVKISGMTASFLDSIPVGFPAGIALNMAESILLVSGQAAESGTSVVYSIDVASKSVTAFNKGIESSADSGGLHRAKNADVLSWCGVTSGANGTVFKVTLY